MIVCKTRRPAVPSAALALLLLAGCHSRSSDPSPQFCSLVKEIRASMTAYQSDPTPARAKVVSDEITRLHALHYRRTGYLAIDVLTIRTFWQSYVAPDPPIEQERTSSLAEVNRAMAALEDGCGLPTSVPTS